MMQTDYLKLIDEYTDETKLPENVFVEADKYDVTIEVPSANDTTINLTKLIKDDDFLEFDKIILGNFANFASNQEQLSNLSHLLASRNQDTQPCFSLQ